MKLEMSEQDYRRLSGLLDERKLRRRHVPLRDEHEKHMMKAIEPILDEFGIAKRDAVVTVMRDKRSGYVEIGKWSFNDDDGWARQKSDEWDESEARDAGQQIAAHLKKAGFQVKGRPHVDTERLDYARTGVSDYSQRDFITVTVDVGPMKRGR